jgi:hypothetical protein
MNDAVEPTVQKIEGFVEGFFWILPNLGIALVVLLLFLAVSWGARHGVRTVLEHRGRGTWASCWAASCAGP